MKSCKPAYLFFMFISYTTCSSGQLLKQYTDSARIFQEQKKMDEAIKFYSKAKEELKKDSVETISYALTCINLAGLYFNKGWYEQALPQYLDAKQIREKILGKAHPDYATSCNSLARLYYYMGQYEQAEPLYIEAIQIREKVLGKEHPDYAASCNNLALLYGDTGQFEKAEALLITAKGIREKALGKEHPDYATSCNNLANLYLDMGQFENGEPLYLEAKQIREKLLGKEHPAYASSCNNLALLYLKIGQYEKAAPLFLQAKEIREKALGKEHPDYAASCANAANVYFYMGKYEQAAPLYIEAIQIREKVLGKTHPDYAKSCINLANLYEETKQYRKAEPLYLEAKQIAEKMWGKEHPDYATSCYNLAFLYQEMGQYKQAELLYLKAKQIQEKALGKHHRDYGISCESLANLYRLMHQPLQAEKEFKEAFSVNTYNVSSVFQFMNEKEKEAYVKNISGEDDDAYSFYVSEKNKSAQPYSLSLFHRNLILSSSEALKKQLFAAKDTTAIHKYEEWMSLKKQLSVLYSRSIEERKEDAAIIEEKTGQLEKELARFSSVFAKQQQRMDWKDIQNKLLPDEASIEFASFHFYNGKRFTDTVIYVALVLRKDSLLPATVSLFNEKQLQNVLSSTGYKTTNAGVQRLYTSHDNRVENSKNTTGKSIYKLIWKPLEKELTGIKTVYFAPSGILHRIAFAALPVNNKEVLSDRYKLVQLATTATVVNQQRFYITGSDKMQLYGGISYHVDTTSLKDVALAYHPENTIGLSLPDAVTRSVGWNELPGTTKEIISIVSLSGNYQTNITAYSGINATEESIKSLDGKASPAVLHIATHGFFFPDPKQNNNDKRTFESGNAFKSSDDPLMRSGLLFAGANNAWQNKQVDGIEDGILTAYEVSNLYLPNTKLVVLSACETGLGEIIGSEGVYGLQRAFKMAGVQNLVMSLWKVSDLETAEFMKEFYKNMFAQQTISDAFYNAQNIMKNKYRLQPYKWAAWVLVR